MRGLSPSPPTCSPVAILGGVQSSPPEKHISIVAGQPACLQKVGHQRVSDCPHIHNEWLTVDMRPIQHIYVTAHGRFKSGAWVGEQAQFGLRLVMLTPGARPAKGDQFEMPLNGDAVSDQGSSSGTNGALYRTWTGRIGGTGSTENFSPALQIEIAEDIRKFLEAIKATTSSAFEWFAVKMMPVAADGKVCTDQDGNRLASSIYQFTTPVAGSGTGLLPPQCSVAVSMRAPVLGRRGRGRIYLPALADNQCTSDGVWATTGGSATVRPAFVTLINDLQDYPGADADPMVCITSPGKSTAFRPLEVRTGQRIDTVRSRREQVAETYTTTAL